MKSGIFAELREKGININNNHYVKVTAPGNWVKKNQNDYFCANSQIEGGDGTYIFDGNLNTAYATLDEYSTDFKNVSVEFVKAHVYIYSYSIKTLCGPSREIVVEGSNSGNHWIEIDHITNPLSVNAIATFTCEHPGIFKFIRFTQVGSIFSNSNYYRFHLNEIEIYGHFVYPCTLHYKRNGSFLYLSLVLINLILSIN